MFRSFRESIAFTLVLCLLVSSSLGEDTCSGEGTCAPDERAGAFDASVCAETSSIYDAGGSAQAYRSGAPLSNVVCRPEVAQDFRYKRASWTFSRRSFKKGTAPQLDVTLNVLSCQSTGDKCMCGSLSRESAGNASSVVEIWQTLPDGRYAPLRQRVAGSNECRAQVPLGSNGVTQFSTVAPGSTGTMGGLGPGGSEWFPYGPPVIHLLVRAAGHAPVLLDVPILFDRKTLESRSFSSSDLRGSAWVRRTKEEPPMKIRSWEGNVKENKISLELDVFVRSSPEDQASLCESFAYGLPGSFFLEPISVCAPSMLDFFAL